MKPGTILSIAIVQPYHFEKYTLGQPEYIKDENYKSVKKDRIVEKFEYGDRYNQDIIGKIDIFFSDGTKKWISIDTNGLQVEENCSFN